MTVAKKLRPPPKRPTEYTPEIVVRHGWRDEQYNGPDQCGRCWGWGTVPSKGTATLMFNTCAMCLGTGRERPPAEGKVG